MSASTAWPPRGSTGRPVAAELAAARPDMGRAILAFYRSATHRPWLNWAGTFRGIAPRPRSHRDQGALCGLGGNPGDGTA